jgi:hypothetical protein
LYFYEERLVGARSHIDEFRTRTRYDGWTCLG